VTGQRRGPAFQIFDPDGTLKLTRFVLNPDFAEVGFSVADVASDGVLVCGEEIGGLQRGYAFQTWNGDGNLLVTRFVLNPDFTENQCVAADLDGVAGDEIITGGLESEGFLTRGPAFQVWNKNGSLLVTRFVLNPDFTEAKFAVADLGSKNIAAYGRETAGLARGPALQVWDGGGALVLTRFFLNPDFRELEVFGANTTNGVAGEELITGGLESEGLARGPAFQVWDKNGNLLLTRFVLNPDFTEVRFHKVDTDNDGIDEILVVGRETGGLQRGAAFQVWAGNGNVLLTRFALNADFSHLRVFVVDQDGDGNQEIGIGGVETAGLMRGPAYQIWQPDGTVLLTRFVLSQDF
jgi:hypothetical protein